MHQLANSILIFDEIQTLPIKTIHLFNNAINFLVQFCGSTVVLCTATQPLLNTVDKSLGAILLDSNSKIIADEHTLSASLRRTQIVDYCKNGGWTYNEVAAHTLQLLQENGSVLVIVNTKKSALNLYRILCNTPKAEVYHLSTNMCPAHRKKTFSKIRLHLETNQSQPIICISTQLIEAGVDIDFGSVIRFLAGLDSIAQAAGRCNRHGRNENLAPVHVINSVEENVNSLIDIIEGQKVTERIFNDFNKNPDSMDNDLLSPKAMNIYYKYYFEARSEEMKYLLNPKSNPKIGCNTSLLELLSENKVFKSEYIRNNLDKFPEFHLHQAFDSASQEFEVIDAPTSGVIVPYGEMGKQLIAELTAAFTNLESSKETQKSLLRKSQHYAVNVFENLLKELSKNDCLYQIKDTGIYCLDERYYNDEFGISIEETMKMTFLNL